MITAFLSDLLAELEKAVIEYFHAVFKALKAEFRMAQYFFFANIGNPFLEDFDLSSFSRVHIDTYLLGSQSFRLCRVAFGS